MARSSSFIGLVAAGSIAVGALLSGVSRAIADHRPRLGLQDQRAHRLLVARLAANASQNTATGLALANSLESAILTTLAP